MFVIVTVVTGEASLMVFGDGVAGKNIFEDDRCIDNGEDFF